MTATKPEGGYLRAFYANTIMIRSITSSWRKFLFLAEINDERIGWTLCGNVVLRERAMAWASGANMGTGGTFPRSQVPRFLRGSPRLSPGSELSTCRSSSRRGFERLVSRFEKAPYRFGNDQWGAAAVCVPWTRVIESGQGSA
jgi:hypothetical protein